jgi:glutaredoxin-like protein
MSLLSEDQKRQVMERFAKNLLNPVTLTVFTQEYECNYCKENRELAQDLASATDKIKLEIFDLMKDKEKAAELGVDKVPATVIRGEKGSVRLFGVPAGYEFSTFLTDIILLSRGETELSPETRKVLATVKTPVHVQVFVTPTCPYCPGAVSLAHQFAMENSNIQADMVEVSEFPQLAVKYNVMGVPKIIINETIELIGLQPEQEFLRQVQAAARPNQANPTYA